MYQLLELYARPLRRHEPVVCVDEKTLQLLTHSRPPMPTRPGSLRKEDLRVRASGHLQPVRSRSTQGGHANGCRNRTSRQGRLRCLCTPPARHHLPYGSMPAPGAGQSEHPLRKKFRRCLGCAPGRQAAAPGPIPRHAQARKLIEHGRDGDRSLLSPMSEHALRHARYPSASRPGLATAPQRPAPPNRVDVHQAGRRLPSLDDTMYRNL